MISWKYLREGVELEEPEFESEPCYLRAVPNLGESLKTP